MPGGLGGMSCGAAEGGGGGEERIREIQGRTGPIQALPRTKEVHFAKTLEKRDTEGGSLQAH